MGPEALFFRASSRTVPYVKTVQQHDRRLPIVSITIGPTLDQNLSHQSVRRLLVARGYGNDVEIKESKIPLTRAD
jgi:hypothetical protein